MTITSFMTTIDVLCLEIIIISDFSRFPKDFQEYTLLLIRTRSGNSASYITLKLIYVRYADITYVINRIRSIQIESVLSIEDEY
jgi:hypothetical protein